MKRPLVALLLLLATGCVYYNGMYNTKALAKRARKAEREGRTFDAANLWGQVSVKADTLLVQHPRSKYAEEARLLLGTARARLKDCATALPPLESVMLTSRRKDFAEEAAELVGGCRVAMGEPAAATAAYARLTSSANPERRDLALYAHGQALRLDRQYQTALDELRRSQHPGAVGERAAALAGLGQLPEATAVVDSLLEARDTLAPWSAILEGFSRHDADLGAALTDRLAAASDLSPGLRGQLLIDEAGRLSDRDPELSTARLQAAEALAQGLPQGTEARMQRLTRQIAQASTIAQLEQIADGIESLSEGATGAAPAVQRLVSMTRRVALAADSTPAGTDRGDLRLFVAGELARDSLGATQFAAIQFRRVATEWPASPFAPKAVLALIMVEPRDADSLRVSLQQQYPTSPYLQLVQGEEAPRMAELEDSLQRFAATFRPEGRRGVSPVRTNRQPAAPTRTTVDPQ